MIFAPPSMTNPDFRKVRLRDECAADPGLVDSTRLKLIKAGAKWIRQTVDGDGDVIFEGWRERKKTPKCGDRDKKGPC